MPRHLGTHRFDGIKIGQQPLQAALDGYRDATKEPLTFNVDYNLAGAIRTPSIPFTKQIEIDGYLSAAGATAFQYLQDVWEALPPNIYHNVTINLAAGVHRPRNPENSGNFGWNFLNKNINTLVQMLGASGGSFITVVSSQAITSTQSASNDPWVDVSPATPYAGLNLKGLKAVLSTGQVATIHDHTSSRLFLLENLSPTGPTTVIVARPGTELRNSYNDTSAAKTSGAIQINNANTGRSIFLENMELSQFNTPLGVSLIRGGVRVSQMLIDFARQKDSFGLTYTGSPRGWQTSEGTFTFVNSSFRSDRYAAVPTAAIGVPLFVAGIVGTFIQRVFLNTSNSQVVFQTTSSNAVSLIDSVIDGYHGLTVEDNSGIVSQHTATGKRMTIRNCTLSPGLNFNSHCRMVQAQFQIILFENIQGQPCVRIGNNCSIDQTQLGGGFQNGLVSNGDVGIEIVSTTTKSTTILDSSSNVSGTAGEVRFGGNLITYASISSDGPYVDMQGNFIRKL